MHGMFAEGWPAGQIKNQIASEYGERVSLRSIERYKSEHWRKQREMAQQAGVALALTRYSLKQRLGISWMATLQTGRTNCMLPEDMAPALGAPGKQAAEAATPLRAAGAEM